MMDFSDKSERTDDGIIRIAFSWVGSDESLPTRKGHEAQLLRALSDLNTALGGGKFQVVDVDATPRDVQSVVTIETDGAIDPVKLKELGEKWLGEKDE